MRISIINNARHKTGKEKVLRTLRLSKSHGKINSQGFFRKKKLIVGLKGSVIAGMEVWIFLFLLAMGRRRVHCFGCRL